MPSLTPLARLRARRYSDSQPRDSHGRFASSGGDDSSSTEGGGGGGGSAALPWQTEPNGHNVADATAFAADHFTTASPSPSELDAVKDYEASSYENINNGLRNPGFFNPQMQYSDRVAQIDSAIGKSTVDTNVVTYRGMGNSAWPQVEDAAQNGGTFTDNGYTSTTLVQGTAEAGFHTGHQVQINIPAGSHALSMTASGVNPTDTMQESEVLLPIRVESVVPDTHEPMSPGSSRMVLVPGHAVLTYLGTSAGIPGSTGKLTRAKAAPTDAKPSKAAKYVWDADDIEWHKPAQRSLTPLARLRALRYSDSQPRDSHGRWTSSGGDDSGSTEGGGGGGSVAPITASELAGTGPGATSGPGASRPVSQAEFNQLAAEGQDRLQALSASSPTTGLDQNFDSIKSDAYQQVQQSWGGATYDAHTGEAITGNENKYALTVGGSGNTVTIPEGASQADFNAAMDQAKANFSSELQQEQRCLGVFHNDDAGTIEIDPVLVVDNLHDVETIGAATHAVGGAYNFADGNGYWPPHVAEPAAKAA